MLGVYGVANNLYSLKEENWSPILLLAALDVSELDR